MRALVLALIRGFPASARDTVETETPATFASSSILVNRGELFAMKLYPKLDLTLVCQHIG